MKHASRVLLCSLICLVLPGLLSACSHSPTHGRIEDTGPADRWTSAALPFPDGESLCPRGEALLFDPETGDIAAAGGSGDAAGLFFYDRDLRLTGWTALPGEGSLEAAAFAPDGALWYVRGWGESARITRARDGKAELDMPLSSLVSLPAGFVLMDMAADADGGVWLSSGEAAYAYSVSLDFLGEAQTGGTIYDLVPVPGEDGGMRAVADYGKSRGAVLLDPVTGGYSDPIPLDSRAEAAVFSADGTLYVETPDGIGTVSPDGEARAMDFLAAGLTSGGTVGNAAAGEVSPGSSLLCAGENRMFFRTVLAGLEGMGCRITVCDRQTEGEDDGAVTVQIAFAHGDPPREKINAWNAAHPDIRVTALDYTEMGDGYDGGAQKLMIDMLNGLAAPDLVVGDADSLEITTLARKNMTVDLLPYFRGDEKLDPDNIFGIALRFFDNGQGGLWGFAPDILPETWVSTRELLGPYGSDEGWGLEEYLDFAESLPEGRFLSSLYGARGVNAMYLPGLFESFVDRESGTCSFDSPLFARVLHYLESLPTYEEIFAARPEFREQSELTRAGFYALSDCRSLYGSGVEYLFGTRDFVIVGYPSDNPAARVRVYCTAYVIPKAAPHPDEAWEVLRFFLTEQQEDGGANSLFKSDYDADMQSFRDKVTIHLSSGGWSTWNTPRDEFNEEVEAQIRALYAVMEPGETVSFDPPDEEQIARVRDWLDEAGGRAIDLLPPEVNALIREEISAYLGGVGTAEDCAAKIQSRVSLWLGENG